MYDDTYSADQKVENSCATSHQNRHNGRCGFDYQTEIALEDSPD